jgi:hypothetical protein
MIRSNKERKSMNRCVLFVGLMFGFHAAVASGEDYLLRLDNTWSIHETANDEKPPDAIVLRSIEVLARPNQPFHAQIQIGNETLKLAGTLKPAESGGFTIDFCHEHIIDTGATVATGINQVKPLLDETKVNTIFGISVEKPVCVGEMSTAQQSEAHPRRRVHIRLMMHLTPYQPMAQ